MPPKPSKKQSRGGGRGGRRGRGGSRGGQTNNADRKKNEVSVPDEPVEGLKKEDEAGESPESEKTEEKPVEEEQHPASNEHAGTEQQQAGDESSANQSVPTLDNLIDAISKDVAEEAKADAATTVEDVVKSPEASENKEKNPPTEDQPQSPPAPEEGGDAPEEEHPEASGTAEQESQQNPPTVKPPQSPPAAEAPQLPPAVPVEGNGDTVQEHPGATSTTAAAKKKPGNKAMRDKLEVLLQPGKPLVQTSPHPASVPAKKVEEESDVSASKGSRLSYPIRNLGPKRRPPTSAPAEETGDKSPSAVALDIPPSEDVNKEEEQIPDELKVEKKPAVEQSDVKERSEEEASPEPEQQNSPKPVEEEPPMEEESVTGYTECAVETEEKKRELRKRGPVQSGPVFFSERQKEPEKDHMPKKSIEPRSKRIYRRKRSTCCNLTLRTIQSLLFLVVFFLVLLIWLVLFRHFDPLHFF